VESNYYGNGCQKLAPHAPFTSIEKNTPTVKYCRHCVCVDVQGLSYGVTNFFFCDDIRRPVLSRIQ